MYSEMSFRCPSMIMQFSLLESTSSPASCRLASDAEVREIRRLANLPTIIELFVHGHLTLFFAFPRTEHRINRGEVFTTDGLAYRLVESLQKSNLGHVEW